MKRFQVTLAGCCAAAFLLLVGAAPAQAQYSIAPLATFGTGGWLAPNGYNGSTYGYLTTGDTERGLAYANNRLYLVSRNGGDFVRVLDAQTGQDLGALNAGTGIVNGGTFNVNMAVVGGDGAIYVCNLATGPTSFRIYRWANDLASTTPTVVYDGVPLAGARVGDSLGALGSGSATRLVAGFNSNPSVSGNNGYVVIDPTAGTATAIAFDGTSPAAGDFRLGISFIDYSHVIGTQGGGSSPLRVTSYSGSSGTLLASPNLASTDERPVSFAIVQGFPLLAALGTADSHVSLYDLTDPANPLLLAQGNATTGTLPTDNRNTGAIAWGDINGNTATLYAMASDQGIQAFTVALPEPQPPFITNQPQDQTVFELSPATFNVGANGIPAPTYQWYREAVPVSGATNASYIIPSAAYDDNGARFEVVVENVISNVTYAVTSSIVTLTVLTDSNRPVLIGARSLGLSQVEVSFSERVSAATAASLTNYTISSSNGILPILSASQDPSQSNAVLDVSLMTEGMTYTLVVNNVADQSAAGNVIAPDSQTNFVAVIYVPSTIGDPSPAGGETVAPGGYDLTSGGTDIGGSADRCRFSYQLRTGDFDVAVRLAGLSPSDVWAKAGLMARESLDPGSRFAAALATPAMVGAFLEWRDPAGSLAGTSGNFPANYPNTWLRLRRRGNSFAGFASYDGETWSELGNVSISMPGQLYVGFGVSSHSASQTTTARFRDVLEVTNAVLGSVAVPHEPLGPCSRRTPLVISEIMYQPAPRPDGKVLEFVEIYNTSSWWEDISGYRLTGDYLFSFPPGTIIPGGGFAVVAPVPANLQTVYGITNVFGPCSRALKPSRLIQLRDEQDAILLDLTYETRSPWPAGAGGTGHSLVLANPSYGEADPRAWSVSDAVGGSPGTLETYRPSPLRNVVINEFLAHPDGTRPAYVELYNHSRSAVDLSGCLLTDDPQVNKCTLPTNSVLGAGGYLVVQASELGFDLSPVGGLLLFKASDGGTVLDAVSYEPQALNVSCGRYPDGAADFYPMAANTPGAANGSILVGDIVLNEIMYRPISGDDDDQYVELYNQGPSPVDLGGWTFTAGMHFTFTPDTILGPGAYLVVARNVANLLSHYPQLNPTNTVGNFTGRLPHGGGRLALARPDCLVTTNAFGMPTTNTILVVEDEVTYGVGGRWGQWAHGGGSSLELIHPRINHRLADNWADSDESTKSSWATLEFTGPLDNGANYNNGSVDMVQLGLLDVGEALVDDIEVRPGTTGANYVANPDFESGLQGWTPQGDHIRSGLETGLGGYQSNQSLHLRASDGVWTMFNSVQGTLTNTTLRSGSTATLRLKGRWLHGSPEVLMRVRGNWIEVTGALPVPVNVGTPGLPNSQAVDKPAPAIYEVKHSPPIPPANQPVLVTARCDDVDGSRPALLYRVDTAPDPSPTYNQVPMVDDGTGGDAVAGDGLYSARIPAQAGGTVVAFLVQARNTSGVASVFPKPLNDNSGLPRECVVVFGDPVPLGSFDHEHLWMTQNWISRWDSLGGVSNESHDGTFVDGYSGRTVYNVAGRYAGSPYHQYTGSPVSTTGGMHWTMPEDDRVFGTASFNKQHVPGNGPLDDDTLQREQTSFWMARQLGVPWNYRRYYILYVNGNRHGPLMEDSQVPGADLITEHWPHDENGFLYKNNGWFEGDKGLQPGGYMNFTMPTWCLLGRFTTTINGVPGQYKQARYRWMYWVRQYPDSANNFTNVYALITAANMSSSDPGYYTNLEALVDTEEFMRMSALEHATGDWDSWFTQNAWNMYIYKPQRGRWTALKWDWNITLGGGTTTWPADGSQLFNIGANDAVMARFQNYTPYRRAYLRAFKEIADRAMNNSRVNPVLDAKYSAFVANGISAANPAALKSWIGTMHNSLLRALTNRGVANLDFMVDGPTNVLSGTNFVVFTGTAPVEVKDINVNGAPLPLTWTTPGAWKMNVPLVGLTNVLTFQGIDLKGATLADMSTTIWAVNTNAEPVTLSPVRINEWMANNNNTLSDPADGMVHDWFELYNPNAAILDLSGYYLTDALSIPTKWRIPPGTAMAPCGFLLIWADGGLSSLGSELHASFKLSKSGGVIGLFDPQGNAVDTVSYGPQKGDISQGRWPDGTLDIYSTTSPTPGAPNKFVNSPPKLAAMPSIVAWAGNLLSFPVTASDPNSPPQVLSFSLDPGAPAGAAIDPATGLFTWVPSADQAQSTNQISIRVSDSGIPALSDSVTMTVIVRILSLSMVSFTANGQPSFTWSVEPGWTYRVECKTNLNDPTWQTLADLPATGSTLTFTDTAASGFAQRFYRVVLLP